MYTTISNFGYVLDQIEEDLTEIIKKIDTGEIEYCDMNAVQHYIHNVVETLPIYFQGAKDFAVKAEVTE